MIYRRRIERKHGHHGVFLMPIGLPLMMGGAFAVGLALVVWGFGPHGWGFALAVSLAFGWLLPLGWFLWGAEEASDRALQAAYDCMKDARGA